MSCLIHRAPLWHVDHNGQPVCETCGVHVRVPDDIVAMYKATLRSMALDDPALTPKHRMDVLGYRREETEKAGEAP